MRSAKALSIPVALVVSLAAAGCGRMESSDAAVDVPSTMGECVPVIDTTADVQPTYRCRDGRTCSDIRPDQADGGVYQVCPGTNGCATLVMSNGQSMQGFC